MRLLHALPLIAFTLLAGCGPRYTYNRIDPTTPEGPACVAACKAKQAQCFSDTRDSQDSQRALYEANLSGYRACMSNNASMPGGGASSCIQPSNPTQPFAEAGCHKDYDRCYESCGGVIQKIPVDK